MCGTPRRCRVGLKLIWISLYGSFSGSLCLSSEAPVQLSDSQRVAPTSLCVHGGGLFKKSLVQPDKCDLYSSLQIHVLRG